MNIIPRNNPQQTMTSREMAALTGKEHKNVSADIRKMLSELGLDALDFQRIYKDGSNRDQIEYALDRELTETLLTGYSTPLRHKVIQRWRELEGAVVDPLAGLPAEQRALIAVMVDNAAIKEQLSVQADAIKRLESKQTAYDNGANFFTVIGYGVHKGIAFGLTDAASLGRAASKLSKENGITVDSVRDPRFGKVNSYHESMLDAALNKIHGGM